MGVSKVGEGLFDQRWEGFTRILHEHPAPGGEHFLIGRGQRQQVAHMPSRPLVNGGKELQMDEIVAVRLVNGEPWTAVAADEAGKKALRQPREHLVRRPGIQPAAR